ncbi:MAG: hypothetical protein WDW38_000452 [Sanguina aurantia]
MGEGRGRGVVVTRDVLPGELLLSSRPIAFTSGDEGEIPDGDVLLASIDSSQYTATERSLFRSLVNGNGDEKDSIVPDYLSLAASPADVNVPLAGEDKKALSDAEVHEGDRFGMIVLNSFGEQFQDLAATMSRGEPLQGHLGLWPDFSMINHSCLPTALNYVMARDTMVVRAATPLTKGQEVTINYLGRGSLCAVDERQQELSAGYGFDCMCPRCMWELGATGVAATVSTLQRRLVREVAPAFASATEQQDTAQLRGVERTLAGMLSELGQHASDSTQPGHASNPHSTATSPPPPSAPDSPEQTSPSPQHPKHGDAGGGGSGSSGLPSSSGGGGGGGSGTCSSAPTVDGAGDLLSERDMQWLRASAFDLHSCHNMCCEELQLKAELMEGVQTVAGIAAAVAPGSDLHLFLSVKHLSLAQSLHGQESAEARRVQGQCLEVLTLRYGPVSNATAAHLLQCASRGLDRLEL